MTLVVLTCAWCFTVAIGVWNLWSYENRSGTDSKVVDHWPPNATVQRDFDLHTLVMFIHPHCPCSRASLAELERVMAKCDGRLSGRAIFVRPEGTPSGWEKSDMWRNANRIPNVQVVCDFDGRQARLFGAETSGQTLLYTREGNLLFRGGITVSRGHEGDSVGRRSIQSLVRDGVAASQNSQVFGCALHD